MFKKLIVLLFVLSIALTACGSSQSPSTPAPAAPTSAPEAANLTCLSVRGAIYEAGDVIRISKDGYKICNGLTGEFDVLAELGGKAYFDERPAFDMNKDCGPKDGYKLLEESATLQYCSYEKLPEPFDPAKCPSIDTLGRTFTETLSIAASDCVYENPASEPIVPTPAPEPIAAPVITPTTAMTDTIEVSLDGGKTWQNAGLDLDTELGKRVTFTARSVLVPNKAWDEKLSKEELKVVEQTWLKIRLNAASTKAVVFTGGIKVGNLKFDQGALFMFNGVREFDLRNGEVVLWYDDSYMDKDLLRIVDQILHGNFDIKSKLAFAVTDSLKDKLPASIMKGVQIVLIP